MQDGSTCLILTMSCPRHRTRRKYPRAPANGEGPHPLWRAEVIRSKLWAEKDVPALETVRVEEEALGAADGMNSPKGGTRRARIPEGSIVVLLGARSLLHGTHLRCWSSIGSHGHHLPIREVPA